LWNAVQYSIPGLIEQLQTLAGSQNEN